MNETTPARRRAARELTELIERDPSFSLIRLGDGECWYLLQMQEGKPPPKYRYTLGVESVEVARSVSGMETRHYPRFVEALERASYLDYCDYLPSVAELLPKVRFNRDPRLPRNASPEVSNILFEWTWYEFRGYVASHRCLIASAEAALLRELRADARYRELAAEFWPPEAQAWFHQVREDGRHYSENLDLIKEDLKRDIEKHQIDTLLLSLGTGAKVICYELAKELGVRALDFGSMTRALAYSGTSGYQVTRSMHNPFMFRVPLAVFMPALERAHGQAGLPALIARSHAQLALEIQSLAPFRFNTTDTSSQRVDLSPERTAAFMAALAYYNRSLRPRARRDPQAWKLHKGFVFWRRKMGLGWDGKLFVMLVKLKGLLRRVLGERVVPKATTPSATPDRTH